MPIQPPPGFTGDISPEETPSVAPAAEEEVNVDRPSPQAQPVAGAKPVAQGPVGTHVDRDALSRCRRALAVTGVAAIVVGGVTILATSNSYDTPAQTTVPAGKEFPVDAIESFAACGPTQSDAEVAVGLDPKTILKNIGTQNITTPDGTARVAPYGVGSDVSVSSAGDGMTSALVVQRNGNGQTGQSNALSVSPKYASGQEKTPVSVNISQGPNVIQAAGTNASITVDLSKKASDKDSEHVPSIGVAYDRDLTDTRLGSAIFDEDGEVLARVSSTQSTKSGEVVLQAAVNRPESLDDVTFTIVTPGGETREVKEDEFARDTTTGSVVARFQVNTAAFNKGNVALSVSNKDTVCTSAVGTNDNFAQGL